MKIERFEVHRIAVDERTRWVMLKLIAQDGECGWGEALLPDGDTLGVEALSRAAQKLCGTEVLRATAPLKLLATDKATGLLEATVHATIDQCLWDLRAKHAGVALHRMLGPTLRREIAPNASWLRAGLGVRTRASARRNRSRCAVSISPTSMRSSKR